MVKMVSFLYILPQLKNKSKNQTPENTKNGSTKASNITIRTKIVGGSRA